MKTSRFFLLFILSLFFVKTIFAQKFKVPDNYAFEKKEDYKKYSGDVVKCADWLEKAKFNDGDEEFNRAVNFLGEWVSGCPYANFDKNVRIDAVFADCPKLRVYYMGGWARNAIENNYKTGKAENYLAGLRTALKVYKLNRSLSRSKSIDDLEKVDRSGNLKEWVTDRL